MTGRNLTYEQRRFNREDISLIWFGNDGALKRISQEFEDELRAVNDYLLFYTNEMLLTDYIKSVKHERIVLIVYVNCEEIEASIRLISSLEKTHIDCILLLTNNEQLTFVDCPTPIHICHSEQHLSETLKQNISVIQNQPVNTTDDRDMHQKFVRELVKESGTFLYLHMFKDIVLNMSDEPIAKKAMLEQCRVYYADNKAQLVVIDRFETTYRKDDAVCWYTKDCFVYRLVNKALRTEDIEQLFLFRFYIADLCLHLRLLKQEQQQRFKTLKDTNIIVYRGTQQSLKNLDILRSNIGRIISFNGFLSASCDEHIALIFAGVHTVPMRNNLHSLLLEIHIDMSLSDVIAADVSHLSEHPEEQEILFDMGTTFRVDSVTHDPTPDLWRCKLIATNDGVQFARDHIMFYANEMQGTSDDIRFGSLLIDMCAYSKAENYLQKLLKNIDRSDVAHIHFHLGRICHFQKNYDLAMYHLNTALELEKNPLNIARIMHEIGIQLYQRGDCVSHDDYGDGIRWNERALELYVEHGCSDSAGAAYCINNIGFGLCKLGKYAEALDYHKRALHIRKQVLPPDHALIAQSFRNIGLAYLELGDCDQALEYQQRAFDIVERTVPEEHWSRGNTLRNFGTIYHRQGDFTRACEKFEQALNVYERTFGTDHPDIIRTRNLLECARNGTALPFW
jgi:tetratricopeptide (TPR) repeat protein